MSDQFQSLLKGKGASLLNSLAPLIGRPTCIWACRAKLAEGPVWLEDRKEVVFVDIIGKQVHRFRPSEQRTSTTAVNGIPTAILPRRKEPGFVLAMDSGLQLMNADFGQVEAFVDLGLDPSLFRTNDAKCDPLGRLWIGTMRHKADAADGQLLIVDQAGHVDSVEGGLSIPNGPAFNREFSRAYFSDSATGNIYCLPLSNSGEPQAREVFTKISKGLGAPDGMTVDANGYLWVALHGGGRVARFDPEGRAAGSIRLSVANVTSVTFGGLGLDRLFITTAQQQTGISSCYSGGLFEVGVSARGIKASSFG